MEFQVASLLLIIFSIFSCESNQAEHFRRWDEYLRKARDTKEDINLLAAVGSPLPSDVKPVTGPFGRSGRPAIEFTNQSYVGRFARDIVPVPFFFNFGLKITLFLQSIHGGVIFSLLKPDHSEILLSVTVSKADDNKQNIEFIYQNGDDVFQKKTFKTMFTLPKFVQRWVIFSITVHRQTIRLFFNGCERIFEKTLQRTRTPIKIYPTSPLFIGLAGWYIKKPVLFGALYDLILTKDYRKAIPSCARRKIDELKKAKDYKSTNGRNSVNKGKNNANVKDTSVDSNQSDDRKSEGADSENETSDDFFTKIESNDILSGPQISNSIEDGDMQNKHAERVTTTPELTTIRPRVTFPKIDLRTTGHRQRTNPHVTTTVVTYAEDADATTRMHLYPTTTQHTVNIEDTEKAKELLNDELKVISKSIDKTSRIGLQEKKLGELERNSANKKEILDQVKSEIVSSVVTQVTDKIDKDHCSSLVSREKIKKVVKEVLEEQNKNQDKKISREEKRNERRDKISQPMQANVLHTKHDLEVMSDMFQMGSFVLVSSTNQLFVKSVGNWLEILTTNPNQGFGGSQANILYGADTSKYALHNPQTFKPSKKEMKLLQSNLLLPPSGITAVRPYLLLAALNNPISGHLGGIGGADYLCYKQANAAGLPGGTFRAFLADHYQEIKSLVVKNPDLPIANIRGDQLFASYSSIYSTEKYQAFNPEIPIYSFQSVDVRTSSKWPIKKLWHGSLANGENGKIQHNCKNWRSDKTINKGYSTSLVSILPALNEGPARCNQKLIVLCIQVAVS